MDNNQEKNFVCFTFSFQELCVQKTTYNIEKCKNYRIRFTGKTTLFRRDFQSLNALAARTALPSNVSFQYQNLAVLCVKRPWNGFSFSCKFWCCMRSKAKRKSKSDFSYISMIFLWLLYHVLNMNFGFSLKTFCTENQIMIIN